MPVRPPTGLLNAPAKRCSWPQSLCLQSRFFAYTPMAYGTRFSAPGRISPTAFSSPVSARAVYAPRENPNTNRRSPGSYTRIG